MTQHHGRCEICDVFTTLFGAGAICAACVAALLIGGIVGGEAVAAMLNLFAR